MDKRIGEGHADRVSDEWVEEPRHVWRNVAALEAQLAAALEDKDAWKRRARWHNELRQATREAKVKAEQERDGALDAVIRTARREHEAVDARIAAEARIEALETAMEEITRLGSSSSNSQVAAEALRIAASLRGQFAP